MKWCQHRKWAGKIDIPDPISRNVDALIDNVGSNELTNEFDKLKYDLAGDVAEKSEGVGSAFGIIAENHIVESCDTHEPERRKTTDNVLFAKHKLEFLRGKSKEHLKAWYLHHHLDILAENYERSRDIEEIMDYHKNEYPHTYSEEIRNYLMKHNTELERDLVKVAFRREKQN